MAIMLLGWLLPVTVKADGPYKLVQVTEVKAGGLYVFEQDDYVMNNTVTNGILQTTDNYERKKLSGTETYVWELEKGSGGFYMKNVYNGNYLNAGTTSTSISFGNQSSIWMFTFSESGTAVIQDIKHGSRFLGYDGQKLHQYRVYAASTLSTGSSPHDINVYQLVEYESFTASFSINGSLGSPTQCVEYSNVNFPSRPADIEGKKFIGWSTSAIDGKTNEQPDLLLEATMPSNDITYYAVFGDVVESDVTATLDAADISNLTNGAYGNDWIDPATGIELWLNGGKRVTKDPARFEIDATNGKYLGVELIQGYIIDMNVTLTNAANTIVQVSPGTLTTEGTSQTVTFDGIVNTARCYTDGSHPITISKVVVNAKSWAVTNYCTTITENHPVTITSAAKYATYSATQASDFSETGVTVFTARVSDDRVLLDEVTDGIVPANVGVVLYKDVAVDETVTVPSRSAVLPPIEGNELLVSDGTVTGNGSTLFALAKKSQGVGFYRVKNGTTIPAGRPYLVISNSGAREFLGFDEEPDGITCAEEDDGQDFRYFNLSGQSFTTPPAPGLYVVRPVKGCLQGTNGKKVLIK